MRAAIFNGADRPITVEAVPDPEPAPGDLLIEIGRCGICGSDISMTSGGPFDYGVGHGFGHEYSGMVVEVGREVSGWTIGDRVACTPIAGCGRCQACREGRLLLCQQGRGLAAGFAEYIAVPPSAAVRLPRTLSLADGALVEPMACGLRALTLAGVQGGERILVLGAGAMALSAIWWARRLGAGRIVVASRSARRGETCRQFGADAVHSFAEDDPAALDAALGGPPDLVVECVGKAGMLNLACEHARPGGAVIGMGMCTHPEPILPAALTFKELRLVFPIGYSPQQFAETARALDASGFNPEVMVSHVLPLEQLGAAMDALRGPNGLAKVHIDPGMSA